MNLENLPENIQAIEHNNIKWISIEHPDNAAVDFLKENFNFHALDYEDVISTTHRSKIDKYRDYIFLIMLFPIFNRKTKTIEPSEIDFFLGKDFLITINRGNIPTFLDMFQLCQASDQAKDTLINNSPQFLLYKILQRLFQYCYPIMDHIDLELSDIENRLFKSGEQKLLERILFVRHNIIDMRKIMQPHRTTLFRLKKPTIEFGHDHDFELDKKFEDYFDDVLDYTQEIWNQLESFKESVDALHETNESLISTRINDVMKTLTIFSVIMLPASVIAGLFGVNAKHIPFVGDSKDFFIIVGITILSIVIMLLYIKRKHLS